MKIHDKYVDMFTEAYLEAAFWTEEQEIGSEPTFFDIDPHALTKVLKDCADFQEQNAQLLENLDDSQCGHDFLLTRNGHGVGFQDRGYPKVVANALSASCDTFGEVWVELGDDGKVYGF